MPAPPDTTLSAAARPPPMRWGLIGPGRIAAQFAAAARVVEGASIRAVAGRNKCKAEHFSRQHGIPVCYDDYRALLRAPGIDAVYIATQHRYHHEIARACLLAGKPVLCEKPLTVNAREAQELVQLSRQSGVFLMEALWTRFLPVYEDVKQWLVAGRIGEVDSVSSSFGFVFPRDPADRLFNPELAGGALLDLGVYNLSMSQWVFGSPPLSYTIDGYLGDTGVDEHDDIVLAYPGGRRSSFSVSMTRRLDNDFTIHGSLGHICVQPMFWGATRATLALRDKASRPAGLETACRTLRATGLEYEIDAAGRCIRAGLVECPAMPHDSTLDTMRLMDSLRRDIGLSYSFEQA